LLVNLGSPSAPTPAAVRRFLDEFLGDPLVVDLNPVLWWLMRKLIVLPLRGRSSAALYRAVWGPDGSPLVAISRRQRDALAARLGGSVPVELGMRYGEPSIATALARLREQGVHTVRLLSLFPQASRTTTGTIEREVRRILSAQPGAPALEVIAAYYQDPGYVEALRSTTCDATEGKQIDHYLFSLHGLPVRYVEAGDPYRAHCEATATALARALELPDDRWTIAYQSRFGREAWLEPDTAKVVPALASRYRRVAVLCPGFAADCLETLEEIGLRLPEAFQRAGGEELVVVPCLNDTPEWIDAIVRLVTH
jgi:ferrochelatase